MKKVDTTNKKPLQVLVYKRRHTGDPSSGGVFGINDCKGKLRNADYYAVIGIGGKKPDKGYEDIACKINWIGICPIKKTKEKREKWLNDGADCYCAVKYKEEKERDKNEGKEKKNNWVTFKQFCLYENKGRCVCSIAPKLYAHMYGINRRHAILNLDTLKSDTQHKDLYKEIKKILALAAKCSPSKCELCSPCQRIENDFSETKTSKCSKRKGIC